MTDIKKIFCRSDLWSKISDVLVVQLETFSPKFTSGSHITGVPQLPRSIPQNPSKTVVLAVLSRVAALLSWFRFNLRFIFF